MKICNTTREVLSAIDSNQTVFVHAGAATPQFLLDGLLEEAPRLTNVELLHLHTEGDAAYAKPEYKKSFRVTNLFVGSNVRPYMDYDRIDYLPCFLSEMPELIRSGAKKVDVALIQVSPPDKHGFVSLGVSVDTAKAAVESAKIVIAQINPRMPRVHGDGMVHINNINYAIEHSTELYSPKPKILTEVEKQIGKNVASLVEDGATLQFGIGAIPDAVCAELVGHKHLGLHTEMWSDGAFELVKKGVIDNSLKKFHRGKVTSAFLIGSRSMYDFVDDNMTVLNLESGYINFPINIMRNPKVTAINSAVEIDLTGQVCADSVGSRIISGVGGQVDFLRAAALSTGGKPILALTSTSKNGHSRIKTVLNTGAGVVTTRAHVHYVVTEYGVVNLYGKSLHERARLLIQIAHPDHRENLEKELFALNQSRIINR
ncbi:acetyl-CoA hydrolase/transferase family protein [Peredibacter starrii]|uniref:Acetyl-CoA hydrolase/transferase C-terminal domain-containing protein n=1 Tax=Peredibacter starrii TaxID=28202 RepID=A0AAX4HK59_9BACT|nr:acetyl-CoA hydrolase/transferase C-terminal domain-containing protein [Peredibacter starrii]WPU63587.1 acetyl-CoA hydrolase/transferase C-terminal domain-containing protein [Peredibacter starrii]